MGQTWKPQNVDDVHEAVKWAAGEERKVDIIGAGSKHGVGAPAQGDALLDLSALSGITLYEPRELILSARAGTPLSDIRAALAEQGQEFAFEPADWGPLFGAPAQAATLGGTIAANLSGPRRIKAGAVRDHVLGVHAVSGRGEQFKSGGRVVKNVTGYDLCKLLAGSWGTLAVMTDITVKVLPAAETQCSVVLSGLDDQVACRAMSAAMGSPCDVSAAAHLPERMTAMRLEGVAPSVTARAEALHAVLAPFGMTYQLDAEQSAALWREVRDVSVFCADVSVPLWRLSVAPTQAPCVIQEIKRQLEFSYFLDWAGGLIWLQLEGPDSHAGIIRGAVNAVGGHATLIRASEVERRSVPVFHPQPTVLAALSARIKESFDPRGILNPGRMAAGG